MTFSYESQRAGNESQRNPAGSIAGQRRRSNLLVHMVLVGLLAIFMGPFFWLVSTSLKTNEMMFKMPPQWFPNPVTAEHYRDALVKFPAVHYTGNTLIIVFFCTIGTLVSCSMAAYAFSRLRWPDRNLIFALLLATMMLPGAVTMIPVFIMFSKTLMSRSSIMPLRSKSPPRS